MRIFKRLIVAVSLLAGLWSAAGAQQVWTLRNPITQQKTLNAMVWTGSKFVAVGIDGVIVTSTDGLTWQNETSGINVTLYAVAWTGSRLFAVGKTGSVYTSTNGSSWAPTTGGTGTSSDLYGVASLNGTVVVVGANNTLLYSTNDGASWQAATSPLASGSYVGVAASPSKFLAVNGANAVQSSDGINWTSSSTGNGGLAAVAWAVDKFVVTGYRSTSPAGAIVRTSPTGGAPWTEQSVPSTSTSLASVTLGGQLVAVGSGGTIRYSANGESWVTTTSPTGVNLNSVVASNNRYVAVGVNGVIVTSTDGIVWTQASSYINALNTLATRITTAPAETLDVAMGAGGTVLTSTNGVTWTKRNFPTSGEIKSSAVSGTSIVALSARTTHVSTDGGVNWTARAFPSSIASDMNGIAANGATLVAVGGNGEIFYSTNSGTNWAAPATPNAESEKHLTSIAFGGVSPTNYWMAVGAGGTVRRTGSNPSGSWSNTVNINTTQRLDAIIWAPAPHNLFVAVGTGGVVFTTTNGIAWTERLTGFNVGLYSITYTNNQFVATGQNGHVITSTDLDNWKKETSGSSSALLNVKWDGRQVLAVGAGGTILTSSPVAISPVPNPQYPLTGTNDVPVNPTLTWEASPGATAYRVQVSTTSDFSTVLVDSTQPVAKGLSLTFGPIAPSTSLYWRVNAIGTTGASAFSATQNFTTIAVANSAPKLDEPAANATDVPLSTVLRWTAYAGATSYRVQVSTDTLFANPSALFTENLSLSGNSMILTGLTASTKYFWRVSARLSTGVTAWAQRKFTTTAPAPTAAPNPLAPADGAIGVSRTSASLTWTQVSGASGYQVQVSTTSNFSALYRDTLISGATTTALALPGLAENGVYYWRVRGRNAAGSGPYSAQRGFTTAVSAPVAPLLTTPAQNATGVDVFTAFSWGSSAGALTYRLRVATDTSFNNRVLDTVLTTTSFALKQPLSNVTTYHWRVIASNPAGDGASLRRTFITGSIPTAVPPAPELSAPAQFAIDVNTSLDLTWKAAATARGYVVQVSTEYANFDAKMFVSDTVTTLNKTLTGLVGSTGYFWRVKAFNHLGFGPASEVWNFTTRTTLPVAPTLVSPEAFASDVPLTPTRFVWRKAFSATSYVLQVSTNSQFSSTVINTNISDTALVVTSLAANTAYYWRVSSRNSAGTGDPSTARYFTTGVIPLPGAVTLVAPAPFATGVARSPTLSWAAADNATSYHVQVSGDQAFGNFILQDSTLTVLTKALTNLPQSSNIYWRVRAKNVSGTSAWASRMFVTEGPSGIVAGRVNFERLAAAKGQALRFGLWRRDVVRIRFLDTQGRQVAARIEETMNPGYHTLLLPEHLQGSFYLLDFQAGDYRRTVKIYPAK